MKLTIDAYKAFKRKQRHTHGLHEDNISINLWRCLRQVRRGRSIEWEVCYQYPVPTEAIFEGEQIATSAKKIDIKLANHYEDDIEVYFAWEAKKLLNDPPKKDLSLSRKYIDDGIIRFVKEQYSSKVADAGMLGYILHGEPEAIVSEINNLIVGEYHWPNSDILHPDKPIGTFDAVYLSNHDRTSVNSPITLHHLFLQFDFPPPTPSSTISPDPINRPLAAKTKKPRRLSARRVK